jgi:geranylgeranyl reductase
MAAGAERVTASFRSLDRDPDGTAVVRCESPAGEVLRLRARAVIGADGANSSVARAIGADEVPYVFAYHEIVRSPRAGAPGFDGTRCDVYYQGKLSPDFYAWIFPHGEVTSVGVGSAHKGF